MCDGDDVTDDDDDDVDDAAADDDDDDYFTSPHVLRPEQRSRPLGPSFL